MRRCWIVSMVGLALLAVSVSVGVSWAMDNQFSENFVSKESVVQKVKEYPGTMSPGKHFEAEEGTVEIISVELMTGKEWKDNINTKYKWVGIHVWGDVYVPEDNLDLWVVKYKVKGRTVGFAGYVGELREVTMWKAYDAHTGYLVDWTRE